MVESIGFRVEGGGFRVVDTRLNVGFGVKVYGLGL